MASYVGIPSNDPSKYLGPNVSLLSIVTRNRAPTGADIRQGTTGNYYPIGSYWIISKTPTTGSQGDLWYLSKIVANVAFWVKLSSGGVGPTIGFLTPFGSSPVFPNGLGLVNLTSTAGTIAITGGTNSINFDITGGGISVESFNVDAHTAPGTDPVLPTAGGQVTITGGQVPAGTTANVMQTNSLAANTFTIQVQRSQAVASSTIGDNGVSHFNSTQFAVDSNAFVSLFGGPGPALKQIKNQVFTTTGTYTPTSGMIFCEIEVVGAGGGGGGAAAGSSTLANTAGGGGGGGYARGIFTAATIGASKAVTIGAGGTGGTAGAHNGVGGGTTSVGSLISATGGAGGALGNAGLIGNGGAGGIGSNGDFQTNGMPGLDGALYNGGAGTFSAGGGGGGSSFFGGGSGYGSGVGPAGASYGGGGGGGSSGQGGSDAAGGNGFAGFVVIKEYIA
jgi:hypothetical protein